MVCRKRWVRQYGKSKYTIYRTFYKPISKVKTPDWENFELVYLNNVPTEEQRRKDVIERLKVMKKELKRMGLPFFKIIKEPYYKTTLKPGIAKLVSSPVPKRGTNPPKGVPWNKVPNSISY